MSEEQIKDMILKQCLELTTNNDFRPPISAYNGVDIDDVVRVYKQLQDKKTYIDLVKENQELKKQLKYHTPDENIAYFKGKNESKMKINRLRSENKELKEEKQEWINLLGMFKNQQKEFIEYMTKTIEELECEDVDNEEMKCYLIQRIDTFKEILSKYKEIIGDDK